jgi:SAM-dependent methyltransferase
MQEPPLKAVDRILQRWRIAKVRRYIHKGARVLDIGCADGALFRRLRNRIGSGVGADPSLDRSVGNDRFQLIAGPLPTNLAPEQFDAVTMLAVVEHLRAEVVPELRDQCVRLLKPGGVLLITVPSVRVDTILRWLARLRLVAGMSLHEHHGFQPTDVPNWFGGTGLMLVKASKFQIGLNNLFVFKKVVPAAGGASWSQGSPSSPISTA